MSPTFLLRCATAALVLSLVPELVVLALALLGALSLADLLAPNVIERAHAWRHEPESRPFIIEWAIHLAMGWIVIGAFAAAAWWLRGTLEAL